MSLKLNWPEFSPEFIEKAQQQLTLALNKGEKPSNIVGKIDVNELNMGTAPPDLEILEIGELQEERFRGIFKMSYKGDAYVELHTKVQANPLKTPASNLKINNRGGILAANWPLVVPMKLRISNLVLRGIIVLVVDKHKGVTLVFKNDPLEKVDVNSTFDNIPNIRRFLQLQIETQLRKMFQEDLPTLIHNLSLVYLHQQSGGVGMPPGMTPIGAGAPATPKFGLEHDDISSLDSGYQSDEIGRTGSVNLLDLRTQREKWIGNESIDDDNDDDAWVHGYTFYRNLSSSTGALELGLKTLAVPKPLTNEKVISRTMVEERQVPYAYAPSAFSDPGGYRIGHTRRRVSDVSETGSLASLPAYHSPYRSFEAFTTRPRVPPRASSSTSLNVDITRTWSADFAAGSQAPSDQPADRFSSTEPLNDDLTQIHDEDSMFFSPTSPSFFSPFDSKVVLNPTDNPRAAHLASLLNSNHTINPHTQSEDIEHMAYRTHALNIKSARQTNLDITSPAQGSTNPSSESKSKRSWRNRNVIVINLPKDVVVPQGLLSTGLSERMTSAGLDPRTGAPFSPGSEGYPYLYPPSTSSSRSRRSRGTKSVRSEGSAIERSSQRSGGSGGSNSRSHATRGGRGSTQPTMSRSVSTTGLSDLRHGTRTTPRMDSRHQHPPSPLSPISRYPASTSSFNQ
ncbi:hypothetical protein DFS34DRAFT_595141 [Phlyctochytrium arcticum]|nr:hypothetical protein DFS34DRAFT_595141 [Phlyctochytrium arcticum]